MPVTYLCRLFHGLAVIGGSEHAHVRPVHAKAGSVARQCRNQDKAGVLDGRERSTSGGELTAPQQGSITAIKGISKSGKPYMALLLSYKMRL